MSGIKLWDRAQPLKSALLWVVGFFVLAEGFLLLSAKWMLIGQSEIYDSDYSVIDGQEFRATRSWTVLKCSYWTGRSSQSAEHSHEFDEAPRECPFLIDAL